jgi:hypothetical protein
MVRKKENDKPLIPEKLPLWKLLKDPLSIVNFIESLKIECSQCKKRKEENPLLTIRLKRKCVTFLCRCKMRILYFPTTKHPLGKWVEVPKHIYLQNKLKGDGDGEKKG